jgi:hypothetical protein
MKSQTNYSLHKGLRISLSYFHKSRILPIDMIIKSLPFRKLVMKILIKFEILTVATDETTDEPTNKKLLYFYYMLLF